MTSIDPAQAPQPPKRRELGNWAQIASAFAALVGIVFGAIALLKSGGAVQTAKDAKKTAEAANTLAEAANEIAKDSNTTAAAANETAKKTNQEVAKLSDRLGNLSNSVRVLSDAANKSNDLQQDANRLANAQAAVTVDVLVQRAEAITTDAWDLFDRALKESKDEGRFDKMKARLAVNFLLKDSNSWSIDVTNTGAPATISRLVLSIGPLSPGEKTVDVPCGKAIAKVQPIYRVRHSTNCEPSEMQRADSLPRVHLTSFDLLELVKCTFRKDSKTGKMQSPLIEEGNHEVYLTVLGASNMPLWSSQIPLLTTHGDWIAKKWKSIKDDPDGSWFSTPIDNAIRNAKPR